MKTWRLVSGILSIVFSVATSLSACFSGAYWDILSIFTGNIPLNILVGNLVSVLMLAGGIVAICTRNGSKAGNISTIVLYGTATVLGFAFAPSVLFFTVWCLACAILSIIALVNNA